MKKILIFILTAMLIFALALGVAAETTEVEVPPTIGTTEAPEATTTPETAIAEAPTTEAPTAEASATDAPATEAPETQAPETEEPETVAPETVAPETDAPPSVPPTTEAPTTDNKITASVTTEKIVNYIKAHFEELVVIISLICTALYNIRKYKFINRSIAKSNNNAVALSQEVSRYKESFDAAIAKYEATAEENQRLKATLDIAMKHINSARLSNLEFANELAELLVLANIPNSKKEELYKRHIDAVAAIKNSTEEVKEHDERKEA